MAFFWINDQRYLQGINCDQDSTNFQISDKAIHNFDLYGIQRVCIRGLLVIYIGLEYRLTGIEALPIMIIIHSPSGNSTWQWQIPVFTWDAYNRMKFKMLFIIHMSRIHGNLTNMAAYWA